MTKKIRTLIVDDEPLAREGIRMLLDTDEEIELIGECADGREAVHVISEQKPDLIFLDVQMPEMNGFDVLAEVCDAPLSAIIFVTAYDKYALQAFDVHALDYLLKPFTKKRFYEALERAKAQIRRPRDRELDSKLLGWLEEIKREEKYLERLVIKSAGRIFFLSTEEVDWIEAAENYVRLHVGRESHLLHGTMNRLEARLDPEKFLRVHRSVIVNIERIKELRPLFHGEYMILLRDGTRLTSGRSYRDKLQRLLENF
ncbi:MAG: hypothetical protein AUG51_05270 [Acidobacteria bacterium 13_1_20CM_3_53_8]|nr:MAG: hypothetical protein AUG51_05270 [Acidobacteria bacterium 13_1_20CM_3_53_8]